MPKSKTRLTKRKSNQLTPALSVFGAKLKKRPRGKSFEKGNGFGSEHRFQKGMSGNPGGRTKSAELRKALRVKLASEHSIPRQGRTFAEKLADEWVERALDGNTAAIAAIADNAEGRPHQSLSMDEKQNPFLEIVAGIHRLSESLGPPEGQEHDHDDFPLALTEGQRASDGN